MIARKSLLGARWRNVRLESEYTKTKEQFMKRILLFAVCLAAIAVTTFAQDEADYQKWMKTVGSTSGSLRKNLDAKNGEAAASDAKKLQEVFGQLHDFWQSSPAAALKRQRPAGLPHGPSGKSG